MPGPSEEGVVAAVRGAGSAPAARLFALTGDGRSGPTQVTVTLSSHNVKSLQKVSADLMRDTKDTNLNSSAKWKNQSRCLQISESHCEKDSWC